ncbi:MAG TPA: VIT domain-containing protein [Gammaproteobacteria bacterium]
MHRYRSRLRAFVAVSVCAFVLGCAGLLTHDEQTRTLPAPAGQSGPASPEASPIDEIAVVRSPAGTARVRRAENRAAATSGTAAVSAPVASSAAVIKPGRPLSFDVIHPAIASGLPRASFLLHGASRELRPRALSAAEPTDEIWFIATPGEETSAAAQSEDDSPGTGALLATLPSPAPDREPTTIPLPLEHTEVHAVIQGYVGTVDVTQQFTNPYDEKIEAVYVFPLPEKAAVREFVMTIGDRKIRGILREKEEAERLYLEARSQGYRASLLTQHRPNVFEQKVANIEPGKRIDVNIRYFHTLAYHDGWYSFVFPTVVGPRYNPPGYEDPVTALPRTDYAEPGQGTAVRYLRPTERSAHDIAISVELDAGVPIEEIDASHDVSTDRKGENRAVVELAGEGTIPNRDFVLSFKVAGDRIKSNLLTYVDPETNEGYFTLMVYPPAELEAIERQPVEMVFVLDTSGSMSGRPLEQAKEAVLTALDRLGPDDTFQIIRFSSSASQLGPSPVAATEENLRAARRYVEQLEGNGGTEMLAGIRAALAFPHDERRLRFVTFLTDGFIGNEVQIIGEVHRLIGASRIFSFGVGNAVNRFLLERMASEGRGAVAYLGLEDSAEEVMRFFFERISHPAMTDVSIDWGEMQVADVYPSRLPDLFVGRPVFVTGKFRGEPGDVTVRGRAGDRTLSFPLEAGTSDPEQSFIASLWARLRIADLADRQTWSADPRGELARAIRDTALEYGLMSAYTAFVAVDASMPTAGESGVTVHQAVPVPDGVRYETTVVER